MLAGQTVVFDIVDQLQLPDGNQRQKQVKAQTAGARNDKSKDQKGKLQGGVSPERVFTVNLYMSYTPTITVAWEPQLTCHLRVSCPSTPRYITSGK